MKRIKNKLWRKVNAKEVNSMIAYAAALVLTGVPAVVCESVLDEFYCSLRKSVEKILIQ